MIECERVAVKLLPVGLEDERLELLELRRARIRRQNLKVRVIGVEIARKANQFFDALFRVLQKSYDVKAYGRNAQFPAELDHVSHVLVRDEAARNLLQNKRVRGFHAERDFAQTCGVHGANQFLIEIVHARLAFKRELQIARLYLFGNVEAALAVKRKERVAYFYVQVLIATVQLFHLVNNIFDRALTKACSDAVRAVGAMLRATAAG